MSISSQGQNDQQVSSAVSEALWTQVDEYFTHALIPSDPVFEETLKHNARAHLPSIDVAPNQGKFLHLMARLTSAKTILEVGTLGGYSTIWLARALPSDGHLVTLEYEPRHAEVARENITRAGLMHLVDIRLGAALDTLPVLAGEGMGPFDLIFIDADKQNNPHYFEWALKLSRPGTLIIVDNVVRGGAVVQDAKDDRSVQGVRQLVEMMALEPRVTVTTLQTVGSKGYDGFAMALVIDPKSQL